MKKILFSLVAFVATTSMNAQIMKVMKNGEEVATYKGAEYTVVFEEEPAGLATTGKAKRTGDIYVTWVQLWENGPKFAEYNVGVTDDKAENYGGYYAWGGSQDKVDDRNHGTVVLAGDNDTATKLWGSNWRMPTQAELDALLANCDVAWTAVNGVNGRKFTGKGDYASNSVFLPAAGYCSTSGRVGGQGGYGYYWSSTPYGDNGVGQAYSLVIESDIQRVVQNSGWNLSVRAVLAE